MIALYLWNVWNYLLSNWTSSYISLKSNKHLQLLANLFIKIFLICNPNIIYSYNFLSYTIQNISYKKFKNIRICISSFLHKISIYVIFNGQTVNTPDFLQTLHGKRDHDTLKTVWKLSCPTHLYFNFVHSFKGIHRGIPCKKQKFGEFAKFECRFECIFLWKRYRNCTFT